MSYILIVLVALVALTVAWIVFLRKPARTEPELAAAVASDPPVETPKKYALFLDLETTGLDPENDRITEICVLRAAFGESVHDGLGTLINPDRPIPARV